MAEFLTLLTVCCALLFVGPQVSAADAQVTVSVFDVDATPPLGSQMAYDPVKRHDELTLRCRGIVLSGMDRPIVLCAVDWIGIGNEGHDAFRDALAAAAGTDRERVAVHTLHQHDAPDCDFTAERLISELQLPNFGRYDGAFQRDVIARTAAAIQIAIQHPQPVTHYGIGTGIVREVASNRRILGPDGKVRVTRYTATQDSAVRAEPEGTIDPELTLLSFWNADVPVALLSYYACHPQSYYRMGIPSSDFPGIARFIRSQAVPEALHVHFNGAGGNIGAGKYNDGARENRVVLALKLAEGMKQALDSTVKHPLSPADIGWKYVPVQLPVAAHLNRESLIEKLRGFSARDFMAPTDQLAWVVRREAGAAIEVSCLRVGQARVLHLPGELFVEYQLAAKKMRPDLHVSLAAYGDYGPGYIGTAVAYSEGGYETNPRASSVAPGVEPILIGAMKQLLEAP